MPFINDMHLHLVDSGGENAHKSNRQKDDNDYSVRILFIYFSASRSIFLH
jgi:hypothetical protein